MSCTNTDNSTEKTRSSRDRVSEARDHLSEASRDALSRKSANQNRTEPPSCAVADPEASFTASQARLAAEGQPAKERVERAMALVEGEVAPSSQPAANPGTRPAELAAPNAAQTPLEPYPGGRQLHPDEIAIIENTAPGFKDLSYSPSLGQDLA